MFSKQLTHKLKEDKDHNVSGTEQSAAQCDRIIRTVSCKVKEIIARFFGRFGLYLNEKYE